MREILFRGRRLDNGEWVYGYGAIDNDILHLDFVSGIVRVKCLPGTIGQYTGLTEKNGKKIFEGDIACAGSMGIIAKCEVKRRIDGIYYMNPNRKTVWYMMPDNTGKTTVEILGNVHDNPELLKEATE